MNYIAVNINFLIFALGEIIDLLQNLKDNTDKKAEAPSIRGTENTPVKSAQPVAVVSQTGSSNLNNHMSQQNYDPREKEKRVAAYWAEHTAEKAALEAELESVNNKLTDLQAQIDAVSKEVSPQIAALNKKRTEKIPEEIEVAKQRELIHELEKARADRIYGNDKLMPVVLALGCGIGEEFDITKLRYDKVFIMADADVDGSHICTLMLTFFFRYMRPLIEQGHVYVAQPPLFKVQKGNTIKYAYNDAEMAILSQEMPGAKVNRYKGLGEMNPEQLWETTMNPDNRVIVQITIEDAEKADEAFTILMGDQVEPRRRFIETNAQYAKLDV